MEKIPSNIPDTIGGYSHEYCAKFSSTLPEVVFWEKHGDVSSHQYVCANKAIPATLSSTIRFYYDHKNKIAIAHSIFSNGRAHYFVCGNAQYSKKDIAKLFNQLEYRFLKQKYANPSKL